MKSRQRGGIVLDLIVAGAIAAALGTVVIGVTSAWHRFTGGYVEQGKRIQLAADQPKNDAADARAKQAEADRDTARGNSSRCESALKVADAGFKEWSDAAIQATAAAKASKVESTKAATAAAPYIADLERKAAAAPKLQACEQERDLTKCTLANEVRRQRGLGLVKCGP